MHAIVIDDSRAMRLILRRIVGQLGFEVSDAEDGRAALDLLAGMETVPNLALVDWNMPNMNGLEFLEEVRSEGTHKDLAVIIISTEGREQDTQRGLEAGASAYIKKPFHSEDILEKISQLEKGPA